MKKNSTAPVLIREYCIRTGLGKPETITITELRIYLLPIGERSAKLLHIMQKYDIT